MLTGQEITLAQTLTISLFGMAVSMFALILLMGFILLFRKLLSGHVSGEHPLNAAPSPPDAPEVSEEEVAAIAAAVCKKTGLSPEAFAITSITRR